MWLCRAGHAAWEQAWSTLQTFHADRAAGREATGKREAIDKLKQAVTLLLKSPEGKVRLTSRLCLVRHPFAPLDLYMIL